MVKVWELLEQFERAKEILKKDGEVQKVYLLSVGTRVKKRREGQDLNRIQQCELPSALATSDEQARLHLILQ